MPSIHELEVSGLPLVSVVIPTRNRPGQLREAVMSVLTQTLKAVEAIVVIDGKDEDSVRMLAEIKDDRVVVIALETGVGGSEARNVGMRAARGKWIALLDDDDFFLPTKLAVQWDFAEKAKVRYPIVACRCNVILHSGNRIYPRRLRDPNEPLSEYLICRNRVVAGEGVVQTSTFFFSKALFDIIPFEKGLRQHQDGDWLLKANEVPGAELFILADVLATCDQSGSHASVSHNSAWSNSLEWARRNRSRVTDKAFSAWIAGICMPKAVSAGASLSTQVSLLRSCLFEGRPTVATLIVFARYFVLGNLKRQRKRA